MKILMVIDFLNKKTGGGGAWRTYQMTRFLMKNGYKVDILTTNWDIEIEFFKEIPQVKIYSINAIAIKHLIPLKASNWLNLNLLNYDLIHISKNWSLLSALAAKVAYQKNIPYVFSGMGMISSSSKTTFLKFIFNYLYTLPMVTKASYCIAVTLEEKQLLIKLGVNKDKIHVIPNGIDKEELRHSDNAFFRKKFKLNNDKIILFIGQMKYVKGVHLLIEAVKKSLAYLDGWQFILIGTNTKYKIEMGEKINHLQLQSKFTMINPLFGKDKSMAYHASEFIVIPSISDAMTIIGPEANYCKKPVLISKTAQFEEIVINGGGLAILPNSDSISKGLEKMINLGQKRKKMGEKAYNFVNEKMGWDTLILEYISIFNKALK